MRKIFTLMIMVLAAALAMAQAPEKFTYQAVVRNASNVLVVNAPVGVRVSILQGGINGNLAYMETQTAVTNANGLITLQIGGGNVQQGVFADIDWANGPFFLKTETDPNGGSDYSVTSVQQLLSVPYALYSKEAGNGFSGDYNDLTNKPELFSGDYNDLVNPPTIPTVPTNVSAFNNDAGYITMDSVPSIPTNVSSFTNDAGYITSADIPSQVNADWNATTGVAEILNKPTIPTIPANVSAFNNDLGYITASSIPANVSAFNNDVGYVTAAQIPAQVNADWNAMTGAAQILNKPTNVSTFTNDAGYITSASIPSNVSAFTNDAGYITSANVPTVPANVSAFNNDAGYITTAQIPAQVNADWNATTGVAQILNKPTIPTVPSNVSAFTNDAGYITSADIPEISNVPTNVSAFTNDAGYITSADVPAQMNADWNATSGVARILNKPTIPTVPTNVGAFTNDAHYITEAQLNALLASMNSTIDSLRDRIEELENGTSPVNPDTTNPVNPDPTPSGTAVTADGLPCPGTPKVYDLQGNEYNTVVIGQQCWMKENLRSTQYGNGSFIDGPQQTSTTSSNNRYYYYPGNNASNVDDYGLLYNWPAVMGGDVPNPNLNWVRGICPEGWHVPNNGEWTQFTNYVKSKADNICDENTTQSIAKALATTTNWTSNSIHCAVGDYPPNNNNTGFSVLPAGDLGGNMGTKAYIWTCTEASSSSAMSAQLTNTASTVTVSSADKSSGYSVRCVRDSAVAVSSTQMVVTTAVGNITTNGASCGGTVNSGDGASVVEKGVCWSQMPNPTVAGDHISNGGGTGSFSVSMTGLQPNTTYYVRAYAKTSVAGNAGATYGNTQTFTTQPDASGCGTAIIYDIDNHAYNTVKIGTQCWMKENLRTTRYADGTPVGYYTTQGSDDYGFLYNWNNVMHKASSSSTIPSGVRGVCPIGWHVPSNAEWSDLINFVSSRPNWICDGNSSNVARALAANTDWNPSSTECAPGNQLTSNNSTGFSALPAGGGNNSSTSLGNTAYFITTSGRYYYISYNVANVNNTPSLSNQTFSVRCLRD